MAQDTPTKKNNFQAIAIVGMGSLFAGSRNLAEFWENIINKRDCIEEVPKDYWDFEAFYNDDPTFPDKTYCKRGGFLPEIEFDTFAFGIPPKALESISLNQLLSLKVAGEALLDAKMIGEKATQYEKDKVGVILAANIGGNAFPLRERIMVVDHLRKILKTSELPAEKTTEIIDRMKAGYIEWNEDSFPGFLPNIVAGRIANRFDFGGINYTVDGACAGSLCAIRQAIHELNNHHCDIMLTGGVNVSNDPLSYLSFSKTPALSLKNQIRPYDKNADGMLLGDGIGMLVLKRLDDAEKAGDRIYAVIKGIGSSSDGRAKSIYAPRMKGQVNAIKRAYASVDISPEDIGLIEGHGTATVVGDTCEIKGLKNVFEPYELEPQSIALGSVKSQIGHTTQAAGAASTIKTALSLYHKVIPPMINFEEANPDFGLKNSPFYVNTKARPWIQKASKQRHAAVSAFGFGGVNLHMILEEYTGAKRKFQRTNRLPQTVLIGGSSSEDLASTCRSLLNKVTEGSQDEIEKIMSPYFHVKIESHQPRLGFTYSDTGEAVKKLEASLSTLEKTPDQNWDHPAGIFHRMKGIDSQTKIVAMFPGQGSQYPFMGNEIAQNYPELRQAFQTMDMILSSADANPVSDMVFQKPISSAESNPKAQKPIDQTQNTQPILAAFSSGLYNILKSIGFHADICVGHSFGELVAIWAGGAITTKDLYILSLIRGQFMQMAMGPGQDPGTMLAVNHTVDHLKPIIKKFKQVYVANCNAPDQVVLSGATKSIARLSSKLSEMKIKNKQLPVSGAFHSHYMQTATQLFKKEMAYVPFNELSIPVYSNRHAKPYPKGPEKFSEILSEHLEHPVLFQSSIETIYQDGGRVFVEIGPRRVLSDMVKRILKDKNVDIISVNTGPQKDSIRQLWDAITQLRVLGLKLNKDIYQPEKRLENSQQKQSVKIMLKGRQYLTPETRKKMEAAMGNNEPPIKTNKKYQTDNVQMSPQNHAPLEIEQVANNDLDRIIKNHMANSQLQQQFLLNQTRQLEIMDKLVDQQGKAIENHKDPQMIQATQANYTSNLDHLSRINEQFYHAHLTYLNQQHSILSKMVDPDHQGQPDTSDPLSPALIQENEIKPPQQTGFPAGSTGVENALPISQNQQLREKTTPDHLSAPAQENGSQEQPLPDDISGSSPHTTEQAFKDLLFKLVCNQTGYPQDMLDLDMDIEADLGIDSIKRLEIFSGLHEAFPNKSADIDLSELGELKTLQAIIDFFIQHVSSGKPNADDISKKPEKEPYSHTQMEAFAEILLKTVSEYTGYPEDMLDLDMDIEADLGIDSIKRLEIFSMLHETFPDKSADIDLSELGELKTLQSIIDFFSQTISSPLEVKNKTISTRYVVKAVPVNLPERGGLNLLKDHQILILNGSDNNGFQIKQMLSEKGYKTTLLQFSEFNVPSETKPDISVALHSLTDESIKRLLDTIAENKGSIGGIIHINPLPDEHLDIKDYFNKDESKLLKTVFFIAKHLKKQMLNGTRYGNPFFFTITQMDGKLGLNSIPTTSILQGGYSGLVKSLKKEAPHIFCRTIDISPHIASNDMCTIILEELSDMDTTYTEIGRTAQTERYTMGKNIAEIGANENGASRPPDHATVFLVPGGGRGVTARCVEGLARSYQSKFIILGRTVIDTEEPEWAKHIHAEQELKQAIIDNLKQMEKKPTPQQVTQQLKTIINKRDILRTLDTISDAGGEAVYIDADITDTKTVKKKIKKAVDDFGPITGIIHGAGNLADKLLEKKEEKDYDLVFQTKVYGLKTIMACVNPSEIQYMILFSSISGFLGQIGQADYSLSNEILNKFAHALAKKYPETIIRSVNWGPWDGGMVTPILKRIYKKFDIDVIPIEEGVKFLVDELSGEDKTIAQIIISPESLYEMDAKMKEGILEVDNPGLLLN